MSKVRENGTNQTEQLRILSSQLDQLERENKRLVDQLKEVIRMNSHWQRYDGQREEYVLKLTRTNRELQDKIDDLQRQMEELKTDHKSRKDQTELSDLAIGNLKIEDHNESESCGGVSGRPQDLETILLRKEEEIATLTDLVAKLKERITELENGRETRKHQESEETVMLLQEQVDVCLEDFKQERKDRERCHDENVRLKERLSQVENDLRSKDEQLFVYQEQIKRLQDRRRYTARQSYDEPCCCPDERPPRHRQRYSQASPVQHQAYYYGNDLTELPIDVEIDGEPYGTTSNDDATEITNDETDGAVPHFSRNDDDLCVTIESTDFRIDDISGASRDDVFATMKPADDDETELRFNQKSGSDAGSSADAGDDIIYGNPKGTHSDETDGVLPDEQQVMNEDDVKEDGLDLNNNNDDDLQCPRCLKSFGVYQHCELLDHVNICMDRD